MQASAGEMFTSIGVCCLGVDKNCVNCKSHTLCKLSKMLSERSANVSWISEKYLVLHCEISPSIRSSEFCFFFLFFTANQPTDNLDYKLFEDHYCHLEEFQSCAKKKICLCVLCVLLYVFCKWDRVRDSSFWNMLCVTSSRHSVV